MKKSLMPFMIRSLILKTITYRCKNIRQMDTNDLREKTYEILTKAEEIDHIVTVHLGTICSRQSNENEFLREALISRE